MLRLAIVEDDELYIRQLQDYLDQYKREKQTSFRVTVFHDGDEILENYKADYDIILMDIQMKFVDGMTAAEEIRNMDQEVVIIFITNMVQYAVRGYQVDALDYIVKPVEYYAFSRKLDRAVLRVKQHDRHYISLKADGGLRKLELSRIRYVESRGHDLHFHTEDGEYISRITMQETEAALVPYGFFRCEKGFLVNLEEVDAYRDGVCLVGEDRVPVSRAKRKAFLEAMAGYMSRRLT